MKVALLCIHLYPHCVCRTQQLSRFHEKSASASHLISLFSQRDAPLTEMKLAPLSLAMAFASKVFPHPGGPYSSTPAGIVRPSFSNLCKAASRATEHVVWFASIKNSNPATPRRKPDEERLKTQMYQQNVRVDHGLCPPEGGNGIYKTVADLGQHLVVRYDTAGISAWGHRNVPVSGSEERATRPCLTAQQQYYCST